LRWHIPRSLACTPTCRRSFPREGKFTAKVEIKLTPRQMPDEHRWHSVPGQRAHVVSWRAGGADSEKPMFTIELVLQAVYRQIQGDPIDFSTFSANHASLTRQLYPIIHHQLQPIFKQFGLDQVRCPMTWPARRPRSNPRPASRFIDLAMGRLN
jgi:hypothetical protein